MLFMGRCQTFQHLFMLGAMLSGATPLPCSGSTQWDQVGHTRWDQVGCAWWDQVGHQQTAVWALWGWWDLSRCG